MSFPHDIIVSRPCVGSGFCCKKSPCPYGEADPSNGWCIHLVPWEGDDLEAPRYRCGRYEFIRTQPGWQYVPAFGGGCSSTLFNDDRDRVIHALVKRSLPLAAEASPADPLDTFAKAYPWALRVERFDLNPIAPMVSFLLPRAEWGEGPWATEPDLVEWRMEGVFYPLLIVRGHLGTLSGYVGVPKGHVWYELPEDITDARPCGPLFMPTGASPSCWWLGFHSGAYPALTRARPPDVPIPYVTITELRQRVEALAVALFRVPADP